MTRGLATVIGLVLGDDVQLNPATGMPGSGGVTTALNWLGQLALWGSLASVVCGAAIYGFAQHAGNFAGASKGKTMALAGVLGAALTGVAPAAVNALFRIAK
ncbi:MAG: hypothetical protein ACOYNI_12805 [Acidimicrobiia bacterium]